VHAEQIGNAQVVARHDLLGQVAVEAVELLQAGCERGHHMATGALLLLPVDVVAEGIIEHGLELAPLALCDVALASRALQSVLGRLG